MGSGGGSRGDSDSKSWQKDVMESKTSDRSNGGDKEVTSPLKVGTVNGGGVSNEKGQQQRG